MIRVLKHLFNFASIDWYSKGKYLSNIGKSNFEDVTKFCNGGACKSIHQKVISKFREISIVRKQGELKSLNDTIKRNQSCNHH